VSVTLSRAVVGQRVARLPFQVGDGGASPTPRLQFTTATIDEVNPLLATDHYLGTIGSCRYAHAGWVDDVLVAAMVWRWPTARLLPADGTWLELSRWCLAAETGKNAGSRMMRWVASWLRREAPDNLRTLVSYSDPSQGHTGALYRASGWEWAPTHHRLAELDGRPYPTGNGNWGQPARQEPKDRWLFRLRADEQVA